MKGVKEMKTLECKSFGFFADLESINKWIRSYYFSNSKVPEIINVVMISGTYQIWYWEER